MPQPDFNEQEKYLVNSMKMPRGWADETFTLSYLVMGWLLFGLATYYGNVGFMICAFAVVSVRTQGVRRVVFLSGSHTSKGYSVFLP
jgi:hypothetical protein